MAAIAKVLQNFELVESILLHTASYEILIATSVCTSWLAVVENSKALRKHIMSIPLFRSRDPRYDAVDRSYGYFSGSAQDLWHFFVKTANGGGLFILRDPAEHLEIFLSAPTQRNAHLKVVDDSYDIYAVTTDYKPNLEFWTKSGEKVCRTKCKCKAFKDDPPWLQRRPYFHPLVYGQLLRYYLSVFYGEYYGPGVSLT